MGFLLAKQLKQSPYAISKIIASLFQIKPKSEIKSVAAHTTGNLNFEINYEFFIFYFNVYENKYGNGN